MTPPAPSDADLLKRYARAGDEDAFARLVARHMRGVRMVAFRHTHHRQAAEDVAQAAFLVLAQRPKQAMRSARMKRSALPWLAKVTRYAAANWRRAEERRLRHETRAAPLQHTHYDPTAGVELADAVRSALACLPRRDRRIVELRHLSQMPWDQVARHAGTTPEAARKAGTRALSELRAVLEKRGITAGSTAVLAGLRAIATATSASAAAAPAVASASAPELAKGVIAMLKLQTTTVTTAALIGVAGIAWIGSTFAQDAPPVTRGAATRTTTTPAPEPFVIDLKGAGTLEVLWIAEHREDGRAWSVDGKLLPAKPMEVRPYVESLALTGDEKQDLLEVWVHYRPSYTKVQAHFIYRGKEDPRAAPERDWGQQIHLERQERSPTGRADFTNEEMRIVYGSIDRQREQGIYPLLVERPEGAETIAFDAQVVAGEPVVVQAWDERGERFPERVEWARGGPVNVVTPRGEGKAFVQTQAYFDWRPTEGLGGFHISVAWIEADGTRHVLDQTDVPWSLDFQGRTSDGTYGSIGRGALIGLHGVDPSKVASFELLAAPRERFPISGLPARPGIAGKPQATVPEPKPIPPLVATRPAD